MKKLLSLLATIIVLQVNAQRPVTIPQPIIVEGYGTFRDSVRASIYFQNVNDTLATRAYARGFAAGALVHGYGIIVHGDTILLDTSTARKMDSLYTITDSTGIFKINGRAYAFKISGNVKSFNGRIGLVIPNKFDYSAFYPRLDSAYPDPSFVSSLDWGKISGTPNSLGGYGVLDAVQNKGNANTWQVDALANRPPPSGFGNIFMAIDANDSAIYFDNGTRWVLVAGGGGIDSAVNAGYGLIKTNVGSTIKMTVDTTSLKAVFGSSSPGVFQIYTRFPGLLIGGTDTVSIDTTILVRFSDTLSKVATRSFVISRGYLTVEADPIANAKNVTLNVVALGGLIRVGIAAQTVGSQPVWTLSADTTILSTINGLADSAAAIRALIGVGSINQIFHKLPGITIRGTDTVDLDTTVAVRFVDTTRQIATKTYVGSRGFLTGETDPVAIAKTISDTAGYGILIGGVTTQTIGNNPKYKHTVDTTTIAPLHRIADTSAVLRSLIAAGQQILTLSYGLTGTSYNGTAPITTKVDTTVIAPLHRIADTAAAIRAIGYKTTGVDSIWRTVGKDSIQYSINGRYHAIRDSVGGSTGGPDSAVLAGYGLTRSNVLTVITLKWDSTAGAVHGQPYNDSRYHKSFIDSLASGLAKDSIAVVHNAIVWNLYPSVTSDSIVDKGWNNSPGDAYVRTGTSDSANFIILKQKIAAGTCIKCTVSYDSAGRLSTTTPTTGVDSMWRTVGKDSLQFTINGRYHALRDTGRVDSVSSDNIGSLFTVSVNLPTSKPHLTISPTSSSAYTVYVNQNSVTAVPSFSKLPYQAIGNGTNNSILGRDNTGATIEYTAGSGISINGSTAQITATGTGGYDSSIMQTKYRTDTMRTNVYAGLLGKQASGNYALADSTLWQTKYRTDTMRTNVYTGLLGKQASGNYALADSTRWQTKYRTDTMRTNVYAAIAGAGSPLTMGTFDGQSSTATGATITGNQLYNQSATASNPGQVNTANQSYAGIKYYNSGMASVGSGDTLFMGPQLLGTTQNSAHNNVDIYGKGTKYFSFKGPDTTYDAGLVVWPKGSGSTDSSAFLITSRAIALNMPVITFAPLFQHRRNSWDLVPSDSVTFFDNVGTTNGNAWFDICNRPLKYWGGAPLNYVGTLRGQVDLTDARIGVMAFGGAPLPNFHLTYGVSNDIFTYNGTKATWVVPGYDISENQNSYSLFRLLNTNTQSSAGAAIGVGAAGDALEMYYLGSGHSGSGTHPFGPLDVGLYTSGGTAASLNYVTSSNAIPQVWYQNTVEKMRIAVTTGNVLINGAIENSKSALQIAGSTTISDSLLLSKINQGTTSDSVLVWNATSKAVHKVAQSSISGGSTLADGIYKPTLSSTATVVADSAVWSQNGNTVSVDGSFTITPPSAVTTYSVTITVPVPSLLSGNHAAWGVMSTQQTVAAPQGSAAGISSTGAPNTVITTVPTTGATSAIAVFYHYSYRVQ